MTHQQRNVSGHKSKERTSVGGKSKANNFLRLSLPGEVVRMLVPSQVPSSCSGLGLLRKFQQYRRLPQDPPPAPGHHLEEELDRLTCKIVSAAWPLLRLTCDIAGQSPVQDRWPGPGCCQGTGGGGGGGSP